MVATSGYGGELQCAGRVHTPEFGPDWEYDAVTYRMRSSIRKPTSSSEGPHDKNLRSGDSKTPTCTSHAATVTESKRTGPGRHSLSSRCPELHAPTGGENGPQQGAELEDDDVDIIGKRLRELQEKAVVLYTGGLNPERDTVLKWIVEHMVTKLGITVVQLRVLDRSNYMVVTSSKEDQAKILTSCPFYMSSRFVRIVPWTPDYDTYTARGKRPRAYSQVLPLDNLHTHGHRGGAGGSEATSVEVRTTDQTEHSGVKQGAGGTPQPAKDLEEPAKKKPARRSTSPVKSQANAGRNKFEVLQTLDMEEAEGEEEYPEGSEAPNTQMLDLNVATTQQLDVISSGVNGNGSCAWATTRSEEGEIGFASIYGPHPPRDKMAFLDSLLELKETIRWVFLGDWNLVTEPEDTAGPTALIRGQVMSEWNRLEQKHNLSNVYHWDLRRRGPRFTRQVVRNNRLDQARLDKARWLKAVKDIHHDGEEGASDHIPVKVDLSIAGGEDLEGSALPAWEIAWGRVRQLYEYFRQEEQSVRPKLQVNRAKLEELRMLLASNPSQVNLAEYRSLETEVKNAELPEARILRRRSRQTWVKEGDACSKFFFASLKSKHAREKMSLIITKEGDELTEEHKILENVQTYFSSVYQQPVITEGDRAERAEILQLVSTQITEEEKITMAETMAREKAPGEDELSGSAHGHMGQGVLVLPC
ncbi:hypothetical protein R1sor_001801 [Riccia sorocarpa]|uniref:Endonuclease/exonuclease/phosphatase domain-containing protein n=1 Tax=Riccia sorocarpa TaxID=122646 RepID=A0ABD3H2W6_9MARC